MPNREPYRAAELMRLGAMIDSVIKANPDTDFGDLGCLTCDECDIRDRCTTYQNKLKRESS